MEIEVLTTSVRISVGLLLGTCSSYELSPSLRPVMQISLSAGLVRFPRLLPFARIEPPSFVSLHNYCSHQYQLYLQYPVI